MNILLQLFLSFAKIGITSFGGLSMIPLITAEMTGNGWMTETDVANLVAIAEMTPGPLGVNCSTFAGMRAAGVPGAVVACLGVLTPTLTICFLAAIFFKKFLEDPHLNRALVGIRPTSMGLIFGVMVSQALSNYAWNDGPSLPLILLGVVDFLLLYRLKWQVPAVILLSAALGILIL